MVKHIAAAALVAAASACGGLETPDLSRGSVSGHVYGASAGAYAYVYGAPQLRASLASDDSFEIAGVPVGTASVVLFDGLDRAEMVQVVVQGATVTVVDRTAAAMPLAGAIAAAVRPAGGTLGAGPTYGAAYAVDGTVVAGGSPGALSVELWPLPAGSYVASGTLSGFFGGATAVNVVAGATVAAEINLGIDLGAAAPGCVDKLCHAPLTCELLDGWCYQCVTDADCTVSGETCQQHLCAAALGSRQICEPCGTSTDCVSGVCFPDPAGAYCSRACASDADCPAGLACSSGFCVAPLGCAALTSTFGAPCVDSGGCDDAIQAGICVGLGAPGATGYCSAACTPPADCSAAVGLPNCTGGYCSP